MLALISDIHSNLEALTAVMNDIEKRPVDAILCLGDITGYGPNPRECIEIVSKRCEFCLLGNFDEALLIGEFDFCYRAARSIAWTRNEICSEKYEKKQNEFFGNFLKSLPSYVDKKDAFYVHGSPKQHIRDYILPKDTHNPEKMKSVFDSLHHSVCFVGHSHISGVMTEDIRYLYPQTLNYEFHLNSCPGKKIINVGSIGNPRDRDNRACYVLWNEDVVQWIRIPYDYKTTIDKILKNEELPAYMADRLAEGW